MQTHKTNQRPYSHSAAAGYGPCWWFQSESGSTELTNNSNNGEDDRLHNSAVCTNTGMWQQKARSRCAPKFPDYKGLTVAMLRVCFIITLQQVLRETVSLLTVKRGNGWSQLHNRYYLKTVKIRTISWTQTEFAKGAISIKIDKTSYTSLYRLYKLWFFFRIFWSLMCLTVVTVCCPV